VGTILRKAKAWILTAALAATGGAAWAQAEELTEAELEALAAIGAAADSGDCDTLLKRAEPLMERPETSLPGETTAELFELIASCHRDAKRNDRAYAAALRGTALPESSSRLWYIRLGVEGEMKRFDALAATLEAMTQGQSAALNDIQTLWIWGILREMKAAGAPGARLRALKLLAGDSYAPGETFGSNDDFRFAYAQELVSAGDSAAAAPIIRALEAPHNIAAASVDPRMRGHLGTADVGAAAAKMLARHREWIAREPDRLRPLIAAATNLRQLGRAGEALELLRTAEPRLDKLSAAEDSDHLNWWWNELARTYEALQRTDEAVKAYRSGMGASESGNPNVSQLINLALAQNRFGQPKDALGTLAVRDLSTSGASPYGTMLYRRARACAHHLLGRGGEASADIDYIKSHEEDAPAAVTELFLCLGDMDAAAASAIRRLDDPKQRAEMLLELSDLELEKPSLPTDKIALNFELMKARPDVKAAVARAGGSRRFNVAEI
jgi:tetratricopeptide (TPR) repeat protein